MNSFSHRTPVPTIFCDWACRFTAVEHTDAFAGKSRLSALQFTTFRQRHAEEGTDAATKQRNVSFKGV